MNCPNCGNVVADNAKVCMSCGVAVKKRANGLAIASLICGILGVICCGGIQTIAAIVLGAVSLSKEKNTMAMVGLILGIVGIVLWIISLVFIGPMYTEIINSYY